MLGFSRFKQLAPVSFLSAVALILVPAPPAFADTEHYERHCLPQGWEECAIWNVFSEDGSKASYGLTGPYPEEAFLEAFSSRTDMGLAPNST